MTFYYRLSVIIAIIFTFSISLPFNSKLYSYPLKLMLLWLGYFIIQHARSITTTTDSNISPNIVFRSISLLNNKNTYILFTSFLINYSIAAIILFCQLNSLKYYIQTPTKTIKPFINDNFLYLCFTTLISSIIFTLDFLFSEYNILRVKIGVFRQEPFDYLKNQPFIKIFITSILKNLIYSLTIPLLYRLIFRDYFFHIFLKPLVFITGLNNQLPRSDINYSTLFTISFYFWLTYLSLILLNELFNAYALIGCLNIDKQITNYSKTPISTLLSGMKDFKNPLIRLTAFQEIAYLSTSNNFLDRQIFYRADNWTLLLSEFFLILTNTAKSSKSDLSTLDGSSIIQFKDLIEKKLNINVNNNVSNTNSKKDILSNDIKSQLSILSTDILQIVNSFVYGNVETQSNKRIPNKEIVGFSIIALSEILINAKIEDKSNSIINTLPDCLTILTKVYKGTSEFLNYQIKVNKIDEDILENTSIKIINDLSLSYFFKIVINYNNLLNDLLLPPEVFKLAKWCTDMALEQQKEQKLTTNILS